VQRYVLELSAALAVYMLLLTGSLLWLQHAAPPAPWRDLIALAPMLAGGGVCWAILRHFRRVDELVRRIQFEALAFAFGGTALLTFSYGFLEGLGYPRLSMFAVWPVMAVLWCVGGLIARRRYA
jgi:hypothetical protein